MYVIKRYIGKPLFHPSTIYKYVLQQYSLIDSCRICDFQSHFSKMAQNVTLIDGSITIFVRIVALLAL